MCVEERTLRASDNTAIRPFRIEIPQAEIDDLNDRLRRSRWPGELPGVGWSRGRTANLPQGPGRVLARRLRLAQAEARLNEFPQFTTEIDGQDVHSSTCARRSRTRCR